MNVTGRYSSAPQAYEGTKTAAGTPHAGADFFSSMTDLKRQLADPESDFYRETHLAMRQKVRENDERRKEDAVIDALTAILDNMARSSRVRAGQDVERAGVKLGLQEDEPDELEEGIPWDPMKTAEMQAFAAVLADRGAFRLTESEGETEAEKVRESGERRVLSEEEIAELARQYDPHDMSHEEYRALLDTLVKAGALSQEDLSRLGYKGTAVPLSSNTYYFRSAVVEEDANLGISYGWLPSFQMPLDRDVMGWLEERMEWTVGVWDDPQYARSTKEALSALYSVLQRMLTAEKQQFDPKSDKEVESL